MQFNEFKEWVYLWNKDWERTLARTALSLSCSEIKYPVYSLFFDFLVRHEKVSDQINKRFVVFPAKERIEYRFLCDFNTHKSQAELLNELKELTDANRT